MSWLLSIARRKNLPQMSATERAALAAGTVWIERELFNGRPDFRRLLAEPYPALTPREQAFLDGPVEAVCRMIDPWEIGRRRELPPEVWQFLKEQRFFGLTLPEEVGGLGFSASAASAVFGKLATRSPALSTVVLIPNSVGPGELLLAHGTEEQKRYYLPRLAHGEEIPCFALTEPEAGSDAASLTSEGVLFSGAGGRLWIRLNWSKRYITLAPVATLLGLAFRLRDPENLLGRGEDAGITCALVPTATPGVEIGRYHDPMGAPFPNGPTTGRDVLVPADQIVGGLAGAGQGWRMLMEALSAGRSVSLPAQAAAGAKLVARIAGAYAAVRRQFGQPIGRFEGIEEPLARIAGLTYVLEAARAFTCGAVDRGERPAVVSGIVKYQETELARRIVTDAMDVLGGAALCRGPRNLLADAWTGVPIGITVEGANILTRTLIVFGQGALRCHPWALAELEALERGDGRALRRAVVGHALGLLRNLGRAALLGLSRGRLARSPAAGSTAPLYRRLAWASARFAALADLALVSLGGSLKRKEKLSGRFADALSWLYLATCALRRFEAEGRRAEDLPLVRWVVGHGLAQVQEASEGICHNFEGTAGWLLRGPGAFLVRINPLGAPPSDRLGARLATILQAPGEQRDRLTAGIFLPPEETATEALGRLERAFALASAAGLVLDRIRSASRAGRLPAGAPETLAGAAVAAGIIGPEEAARLREAEAARRDALAVDSFSLEEYLGLAAAAGQPAAAIA